MITYKFCGNVDNDEILKYYHDTRIDCFVHVSDQEGLPVAIMEAECAGIPIVATNAGGIAEQIDGNGVLLPVDSTGKDIADALQSVLFVDPDAYHDMRVASRRIWEKKFNAKKNAESFGEKLCAIKPGCRHVLIITEGFPFDTRELPFIRSELTGLVNRFDHVTLIARVHKEITEEMWKSAERVVKQLVGEDCFQKRLSIFPYFEKSNDIKKMICKLIRYFFDKNTLFERKCIWESGRKRIIRFWESVKYYSLADEFHRWFENLCKSGKVDLTDTVVYSFWNLQPTLAVCMNRQDLGDIAIVTRVHGYDYQDERWEKSLRKPFAETIDRLINSVVFVSQTGLNWYIDRYKPLDKDKYFCSYIGSGDHFEEPEVSENSAAGLFVLVSCGSLIQLKRTRLIIDALSEIKKSKPDVNIEWVHFGDGPLRDELESYASVSLG